MGGDAVEGEQGFEGRRNGFVGANAGPQVVDKVGEMLFEIVGILGDVVGKTLDLDRGKGADVAAGFVGVDVAGRGAGATGAEDGVEMGAAVEVAAHGPVATFWGLAVNFVGVSGHGWEVLSYQSSVVSCQLSAGGREYFCR